MPCQVGVCRSPSGARGDACFRRWSAHHGPEPSSFSRIPTRRNLARGPGTVGGGRWSSRCSANGLDRMAEGHREEDHGSEKLDIDAAATDVAPSPASVSGSAGLRRWRRSRSTAYQKTLRSGCRSGGQRRSRLAGSDLRLDFPEALVGSASMRAQGTSQVFHPRRLGGVRLVVDVGCGDRGRTAFHRNG